ncbi:MAG: cytochrome b/b6 domain-containing protein [Alphaproteobacteria bacterium]|nr:cytochrome b/b6 domain-containing protein [Alphaproteobacteria bacterium]
MTHEAERKVQVQVWDLPTRLFHWALVLLVIVSFIAAKKGPMSLHQLAGLSILALLLFRLVWGFVGGTHARFADFVKGPRAALAYLRELLRGGHPLSIGHNPLGGLMVLALLAALLIHATLGLFGNDDIAFEAPLSKFVSKSTSDAARAWHSLLFKGLLALVLMHIGAALFYLVVKKDNLIRPMITGWKALPESLAGHQAKMGHPLLALAILALAALAVWGLLLL